MTQKITRQPSTEAQYMNKATALLAQYEKKTEVSWRSDPVRACRWWGERRASYAKSTWRFYRNSLTFFMERNGPHEAVAALSQYSTEACPAKSAKTSGSKQKHLRSDDLTKLNNALSQTRSRFSQLTCKWLVAGRLTGLRPCEWRTCELSKDGTQLIVCNAKATNGRANGIFRHVEIHDATSEEREALLFLINSVSGIDGRVFVRIYTSCRQLMHRTTRKLWPKRKRYPTLYSARHQYSADGKARGMSQEYLANQMGHESIETAASHYGKRRMGEIRPGQQDAADPTCDSVHGPKR